MFAIRDACDFVGLRPNKAKNPPREIRNALFKKERVAEKLEVLNALL
jgi:hypothetical protein